MHHRAVHLRPQASVSPSLPSSLSNAENSAATHCVLLRLASKSCPAPLPCRQFWGSDYLDQLTPVFVLLGLRISVAVGAAIYKLATRQKKDAMRVLSE